MNWANWEKKHQAEIKLYLQQVAAVYRSAVKEAAAIGATITQFDPSRPFSFSDYPHTKVRIDKLASSLAGQIDTVVFNGIDAQWTLANNKNSVLCDRVFGDQKNKLTGTQQRKYYTTNAPAREAFKARATNGLGLSDRVWKYTDQFKTEIELGLDLGLRDGLSAAEMSRDLRQYLQQPDKLFRRVRDEHGALRLSEAAKAYNPGRGVYRSSYKNALRLTSTETNIAYRTADFERWQGFDFVIGIEVKKSNNHPVHDMCDMLAGKYPKGFKFTGWHPNCRCYAVPILQEIDDFLEDKPATEQIENTPSNYNDWVAQNQDRFTSERNTPYFMRDNKGYIRKATIRAPEISTLQEPAKPNHIARVVEQAPIDLYRKISDTENEIRMNADFETAVLYDKYGNVQIDKRGKATSVSFSADECRLMKDGILTHNHPGGWAYPHNSILRIGNSFSPADLIAAVQTDLSEVRAVTPSYTFTMKRPTNGWGVPPENIKQEIDRLRRETIEELKQYVIKAKSKESLDRADLLTCHKLSQKVSAKYGWEYTKAKTR